LTLELYPRIYIKKLIVLREELTRFTNEKEGVRTHSIKYMGVPDTFCYLLFLIDLVHAGEVIGVKID
jgi:hypothetical protein